MLLVHCIWHGEKLLVFMTDFRVYLQRYGLLGKDRASVLSLGHVSISILPGWYPSTLVPLDPCQGEHVGQVWDEVLQSLESKISPPFSTSPCNPSSNQT
jgi:hypothetical protein